MSQLKTLFVKDIKSGTVVDDIFMVKEMSRYETRAGKPYLRLLLMDNSGEAPAMVWEGADRLQDICRAGRVCRFSALVQSYKGALQLKVSEAREVAEADVDMGLFLPASRYNVEAMAAELMELINSVKEAHFHALLMAFVNDGDFWSDFKKAPAAKGMHHAYIGGLLEHTLCVCRAADKMAGLYPALNRDLLLTGAVLHDAGKIREFSFAVPPFNYSDEGRLLGHMTICVNMLAEKLTALPDFPSQEALLLKHLILSHHGRYDYGSPVLPMTREAFALNFADDLDAKMNYLDRLSSGGEEEGYQWTDYQRNMERFLYVDGRGGSEQEAEDTPPVTSYAAPRGSRAERPVKSQGRAKKVKAAVSDQQPTLWG
ncbi:3'-_5' exoribonuclease Bsu YhaM [hydrothermal vent metagenome]|uniref:3'->5' exoribonuclease Bsu YhaM n=1 Tax=hydrothermal vent metagenome TaxID=652676 RepID=A0A3B0VNM1_9ZZZZ